MIGILCVPRFTNSRQNNVNPIKQPNYFTGANLNTNDNKAITKTNDPKTTAITPKVNPFQVLSPIGNLQFYLITDASPFKKHKESQITTEKILENEATNVESTVTAGGVSSIGSQSSYRSSRMLTSRSNQLFGKKKDAMPISSPLTNTIDISQPSYHNLYIWDGRVDLNVSQSCFLD
eukprot:gnl/Chilomastix_caulleri/2141.p1 GENE.gnl/Chilomastix_caulleri/2141~~gnl/Chilomastix_caulleri/2141.p1  ORF type:complete len:177 (+),score=27.19 gnl/Chilomastix_caulleri/2141:4-534(+)